jgi:four helix bundle protein
MIRMKELKDRTKRFALDVIRFCSRMPQKQEFWIIGKQLIRCASSVGANYRSACRAQSKADFIAKLSIVEEEADESMYWMELLEGLGIHQDKEVQRLKDEASQLVSIIVTSKKTARTNVE